MSYLFNLSKFSSYSMISLYFVEELNGIVTDCSRKGIAESDQSLDVKGFDGACRCWQIVFLITNK
ncbi:hypothetical protein MPH47_20825 [Psychrobacillus psychrodurans]|uniref:hypothetical protein n=2 Tax=Psychrobacillus psychrodurans TaxID=126157 RepID=UPI001F4ECEDF|nr:hypothetical protein [Psychrobacillus psychrodurans]MCK1999635.1 hypothetical protein [Psychrobacillus psychrodurans]MCZ8542243.1 hypothetical protein [Psychrobacillus psychrodurans]